MPVISGTQPNTCSATPSIPVTAPDQPPANMVAPTSTRRTRSAPERLPQLAPAGSHESVTPSSSGCGRGRGSVMAAYIRFSSPHFRCPGRGRRHPGGWRIAAGGWTAEPTPGGGTRYTARVTREEPREAVDAGPHAETGPVGAPADEARIRWPAEHHPSLTSVHVRNELPVPAPPAVVWAWLVRAELWPRWYPNSHRVRIVSGPRPDLALGSRFRWWTFGVAIDSTVTEFVPRERLAW